MTQLYSILVYWKKAAEQSEAYPSYEDLRTYAGESSIRKDFLALVETLSAHILSSTAFVDYVRLESSDHQEVITATMYLSKEEYDQFESSYLEFELLNNLRTSFADELGLNVFEKRVPIDSAQIFGSNFTTLKDRFFPDA